MVRFDGVMAMPRDYHHPLSLDDNHAIRGFISDHGDTNEPFALGVALTASEDTTADAARAREYAEAGAAWWREGVFPRAESLEQLRSVIRRGHRGAEARATRLPKTRGIPEIQAYAPENRRKGSNMNLSDRHRQFFRNDQFLHAFLINVVFNGVIAWLILHSHDRVPLWGDGAMGVDLLATGVLLPFIMCLIVSRVITGQVAKGKLPPLEPEQISAYGLHRQSIWMRATVLALFGTLCGSVPLVVLLDLANAQPVSVAQFVTFKALWAGGLAAMVSPPMAWWALSAASDHAADPTPAD